MWPIGAHRTNLSTLTGERNVLPSAHEVRVKVGLEGPWCLIVTQWHLSQIPNSLRPLE